METMASEGPRTTRRLRRAVTVFALTAALLAAIPGTASAELTELADETWGVVGRYDSPTTSTPAEVMALAQIGNTLYVGGKFLEVVRKRNEPHHDQSFLAAFDATSGEWIDWWRPQLNGSVFALEASPDGSRLYVGGEFTEVNGVGDTAGLVALDPETGELDLGFIADVEGASNAATQGVVRTIRAVGSWVYVGGSFNHITGPALGSRIRTYKVARLATDGTPDGSWLPFVNGGGVWGLDVDNSRGRVYLTGYFEAVDNEPDTGNFIAVRTSNGDPITNLERFPVLTPQQPHQFEVIVDGDSVWVVGTQHLIHKLNASDLSIDRRWFTGYEPGFHIGGDFQALGILDDRIYATCHCWGVIRELSDSVTSIVEAQDEPVAGEVQGIIGFDRDSGDWIDTFTPDTLGQIGGWAVNGGGDGCLWVGGDLNRRSIGDLWRNGLMRWCDEAGQGPPVGPPLDEPPDSSENNPPTTPSGPAVDSAPGDEVELSWTESFDDTAVATYIIYRNGVEVDRTRRTATRLAPGGRLSVQAMDPFGNHSGFSDPVSTESLIPDVIGYWPLDGTAFDMTGNGNHGTIDGGLVIPGRVVDARRLAAGDSIDVAANSDLEIGKDNDNFTVSAWIRLESGSTGNPRPNVVAAGVARLGTAANSTRAFGRIETTAGTTTLQSMNPLDVGRWHHVSVVRAGGDMRLYVDGTLESSLALAGSTSAGSGAVAITGDSAGVDEVTIHGGALTAGQVADLASPSFPEALWAYYPLEGNAADVSGNGFDGALSGTTTQPGRYGQALRFNGSASDEITISDDPDLRPGANDEDFTVSYWMNLQHGFTGAWRSIAHKGNNSSERTFAMWMRPWDNRMHYRITSDVSWNVGGNSESDIQVGEWTHVSYVKRGNKLLLYLNGELDASATINGDTISNDGDIYIGDTPWFSGTAMILDDFRIYQYGLEPDEAAALAGETSPPDEPPPPVPPTVDIVTPSSGDVTKTVTVAVVATSAVDGPGDLEVEVKTHAGWKDATWKQARQRYEYEWDTTRADDGPVTIRARATDSNDMTTSATRSVDVNVDYESLVLADDAVAFWRLDDGGRGAYDSVDQSHKARYKGAERLTPPLLGEGGSSATLDGSKDRINVRDHPDINTANSYPARTIELWFKAADVDGRQVLWEEGGSSHGISIYLRNGKLHAGAWNRGGADAWPRDAFTKDPVVVGETYHVVLVVRPSKGKLKLYLNGAKVGQDTGVGALAAHGNNMAIGARRGSTRFADKVKSGGTGNYFEGVVDEIVIYNAALRTAQVTAHYQAGLR